MPGGSARFRFKRTDLFHRSGARGQRYLLGRCGLLFGMGKPLDNPARLLANIIGNLQRQKNGLQMLDAWAKILNIPRADLPRLVVSIYRVGELPDRTASLVRQIDDIDPDKYLTWTDSVARPFKDRISFSEDIRVFKDAMGPMPLSLIGICADQISRAFPSSEVVDDERDRMLKSIRETIAEVRSSKQVDESLALYMLRHLYLVEQALVDCLFLGASRCYEVVEEISGLAAVRPRDVEKMKASDLGRKVREALASYVIFVQAISSTQNILQDAPSVLADFVLLDGKASEPESARAPEGECVVDDAD